MYKSQEEDLHIASDEEAFHARAAAAAVKIQVADWAAAPPSAPVPATLASGSWGRGHGDEPGPRA